MPIPRLHPKLMAIGDSLPQGTRSLTVKASYCAQSWPARIAQSQGWDFVSPDHPRPVLFDLEQEIRNLDPSFLSPATLAIVGLPGRILDNFKAWQMQPGGSKFECVDNLATAGAKVFDLYARTSVCRLDSAGLHNDHASPFHGSLSIWRLQVPLRLSISGTNPTVPLISARMMARMMRTVCD